MKHTKKRLLAFLLVLAMGIGLVPLAALTVGAEAAVVEAITVNEDRVIQDLDWSTAYVASPYHAEGKTGQVIKRWNGAYRLSEIVSVPKAGTTLVWTDPVSVGALDEGQYFLTSWKSTGENKWELDLQGTNLVAAGLTTNAHQIYNETEQTVTYMYTTTSDNETIRFASYGYTADGEQTETAEQCPAVYALDTTFADGKVSGVTWNPGAVLPAGFGAEIDRTVEGYVYSNPIAIPKAGTTVSLDGVCAEGAYAISVWRASTNGTLELIYGCAGSTENNAWTKVTPAENEDDDPTYTYAYTSTYDNELIRICGEAGSSAPEIAYVENNAANHAPILKAAGYDPAQVGTPYMLNWNGGAVVVESETLFLGGDDYAYRFSDILPIYAAGTKVTFTDMVLSENATADELADDDFYVVSKFNGTDYTGVDSSSNVSEFVAGVMIGDTLEERRAALANGKRVYTYTTTDDDEFLRLSFCCLGNRVNGGVVAPIVYISTPGEGYYYSALEGLTVYSVMAQESLWGSSYGSETWLASLATRYGWTYADVGSYNATTTKIDPEDADILVYHAIGVESVADMDDMAEATTLTVLITDNRELASQIEALNNDYVCAICVYDLPYRVFWDYETYNEGYMSLYADNEGLNAAGHALLMPWLESLLGENYLNFGAIIENDTTVVKFVNGDNVMGMIGTSVGDRTFTAPIAPKGIDASNMFGWVGKLIAADGTETVKVFVAGTEVTVPQNSTGTFSPLCIDMDQLGGAELRVDDSSAGLRFLATVSDADYKNILTMIGEGKLGGATVTLGTLIVPQQYVIDMGGTLTHASLAEAKLESVDVTSDITAGEGGALNWYKFDGTYGYLAGSIDRILENNYNTKFVGRAYAKLTVDGADYYVYANDKDATGVAMYEKAIVALNDCYDAPKEGYPNEVETVKGKAYSPYTEAQRTILKGYVINVLEVKTTVDPVTGMVTAELACGEYFNANERRNIFTVVGGGNEDRLNDIFGGAPSSKVPVELPSDEFSELLQALGDDGVNVDSICVVTTPKGREASVIMCDGFELDMNDPASHCVEYTYEGRIAYLIGFSNYTVFY